MHALGQPTLLASFPVASSSKSAHDRPILVAPVVGSEQAEAVTAVQGNALWIHDLSSHRAITSYTVPPSTSFHSKPISFHARVGEADAEGKGRRKERRTAIVLNKGEGVATGQEGKLVWVWTGQEVFEKQAIQVSHRIRSLQHIPASASFLAASSDAITMFSSTLQPTYIPLSIPGGKSASAPYSNLIKTFLPARSSPTDPISVVLVYSSGSVRLLTITLDETGESFRLDGEKSIVFPKTALVTHEIVSDAHLDEFRGLLHYYTNNNRMFACVLDIKNSSTPPRLTNIFSFTADTSLSPVRLATVPTPAGALMLMCSPTRPTGSLALFHPAYPAVIDARDTPRSLTTVREVVMLAPRIAGLSCRLSTATGGEAAQDKDAVYLVDVNVPAGGVGIAQLLSSADLTARFITPKLPECEEATTSANTVAARDRAFLESFASALKKDAAAATEVFNAYEIAEGDPFALRTKKLLKIREQESAAVKARSTAKLVGRVVRLVFESALGATDSTAAVPETKPDEDVEMIAETGPRGAYPHAVVRSLIRREWVSDGMWARGGVVRALLALNDWESIMLALPRLLAIPSTSLVAVVHAALHPPPTPTGAAPLSLNAVLEAYLCAPCAAPLHRRAIHTGLNGTSDATRVLGVFADWLEAFRERGETDSGWGMDTVTNGWGEDDRRAPVAPVVAVGKDVPLASLIQHTQLFLDAHLPSLLSYAPAHDLIERLHATLQPLLVSQSALLAARGTIEAFVKLARREEKQARAGKKGKTSGAAPGGTLYSVEEIQL
ncbi:hypothetical protein NliqN6_4945 [Naganishia liquefaciens]|uniref:Uncharacterized protein n=1 Tax=Naganishia liquefaciens TaxID=104408 RepID=A0A8H3TWT8_9TREE|nr:hypothetical protein NliqN6_4945 [Naganishia liquefaciens]